MLPKFVKPVEKVLTCRFILSTLKSVGGFMAQQGELKQINGSWMVRYYDGDGKRHMKKLGRVTDYPTKDSIFPVYQSFMSDVNKPTFRPEVGTLLKAFVEDSYFPSVTALRGSTLRGYKAIWRNHLESHLGNLRIREIRT